MTTRRTPWQTSVRGTFSRSYKLPSRKVWVWGFLVGLLILGLIRGCADVVSGEGRSSSRGSGSTSTSTPVRNTVAPTPAPSVSALRGVPYSDIPAPELISQSDLPPGTGYSPLVPAPGREVSVRFHDSNVGESIDLVLSPLGSDDSTVPNYTRDEFYPDEVWRSVKVHITPQGYAEGDYVSEPSLRLQGESGHWYSGDCFEYGFDDWVPSNRTFVFPVPEWDLPTRPVLEVTNGTYGRFSFPVYVDVG